MKRAWVLVVAVLVVHDAAAQDEWRNGFKIGDRVELHIDGPVWQQCVVTENSPSSVMKGRCEDLVAAPPSTYRRAGGVYILSQGDTRRAGTKPPPAASGPAASAGPRSFPIGERVEIEASHHWVPCVVAENQPNAIMRVRCEEYAPLSRGAGMYMVDRDNPLAVRKATGKIGKAEAAAPPALAPAPGPAGIRIGQYACYGSGGRLMIGLGFKVLADNRYTDLEGGNPGSFAVSDRTVTFRGGHLGGQTGRNLRGHTFTLGAKADCEPY